MKIRGLFVRYNLLFRLIITIVLIICVPMLIIGWIVIDRTRANLEQQSQNIQILNTNQFLQYFKSQRMTMVNTALKIGYEQKITADYVEDHPFNELETIKLLSYYKMASPIASKMFIYFRGKNYIIGSEEKYIKEIFIDAYANSDEQTAKQITDMLDHASENRVTYISNFSSIKSDSPFPGMLLGVSISIKAKNDAVVVYYLNKEINASFLGSLSANQYGLYIFNSQGELMLTNNPPLGNAVLSDSFKAFVTDTAADDSTLTLNDILYSAYKLYDEKLGLSFVMVALKSDMIESVQSFYQVLQVTIILVIVILLIMLASAVYINYRPILELTKRVRNKDGGLSETGEIDTINLALDKKDNENEMLMDRIAEQKLKLTDYMLKNLLEGKKVTQSEIESIGLELYGPYFCVVLVSGMMLNNADQMDIAEKIYLECDSHVSITQYLFEDHLIFICTLPQNGRQARETLAQTIDLLLTGVKPDNCLKLGIGSCEENLDNVRSSYISALISIDQSQNERITYYEEAVNSFSTFEKYPSEAVLRFIQCVKQGDRDNAIAEFENVVSYVSQNIASHMIEQYLYYDIINVFIKAVIKLEITIPDQDTRSILMCNNVEGLHQGMISLIARVCDEVILRKQTSGKRLVEKTKEYINEHYNDVNLNLPMVADHFNISIYTLSGMFNESAGKGFREYIVGRRIEESKKMLLSTDKSVKEIAYDVGFRDVSYFIKAFKKHCGVTPNKFRQ